MQYSRCPVHVLCHTCRQVRAVGIRVYCHPSGSISKASRIQNVHRVYKFEHRVYTYARLRVYVHAYMQTPDIEMMLGDTYM